MTEHENEMAIVREGRWCHSLTGAADATLTLSDGTVIGPIRVGGVTCTRARPRPSEAYRPRKALMLWDCVLRGGGVPPIRLDAVHLPEHNDAVMLVSSSPLVRERCAAMVGFGSAATGEPVMVEMATTAIGSLASKARSLDAK